ncbi:YicS family protein [Pantoea agglomerans]|jgi:hypothetical protein|uniref:Uncharacterized protein YicS n=1 Tax=[Curtobacterium] plantarum TaxID=221276 RepID=A0ABT9TB23_9GAMM|nr:MULTISPECIES: YicS family protein [Pantoea]KAF6638275.1 hypothetical protein HFD95_08420 [Pantoea sp. EKM10T]KGD70057.1 hypothetical protein ID10_21740 [Pantoea agglomerans]KNH35260.1 hypothetical protein ACS76_00615 [Pantoea vagans]KOA70704.1 hypothetical protein AFL22_10365 [Pantoea sp. CFSAN033090]KYM71173.1 hypothetical protein A3L21_18505 [Pantoea agglomerans]
MNVIRNTLFILPLLSPLIVAAAPYDTLKFALRQQQITDDLRQKCQLSPAISDEKLRQTFLNDKQNQKQNQVTLAAAAQALKNQDDPAYRERMAQVVCPPQTN